MVVTGKLDDKGLADEAVVEIVADDDGLMRILVEIKGSEVFLYNFHTSKRSCALFCQVIQEAALALKSGFWRKELLCRIATRSK